jgi:hypothetical protein
MQRRYLWPGHNETLDWSTDCRARAHAVNVTKFGIQQKKWPMRINNDPAYVRRVRSIIEALG